MPWLSHVRISSVDGKLVYESNLRSRCTNVIAITSTLTRKDLITAGCNKHGSFYGRLAFFNSTTMSDP
jgi:hypothetical protein